MSKHSKYNKNHYNKSSKKTSNSFSKDHWYSGISVRGRVVDAIARYHDWVKDGNAPPYTISFTADEPYCIVRVRGIREVNEGDEKNPIFQTYVYYQIDGGATRKMKIERWEDLYRQTLPEDEDEQMFPQDESEMDYPDEETLVPSDIVDLE